MFILKRILVLIVAIFVSVIVTHSYGISIQYPLGTGGSGTGDVLGPATNTDAYIPQWNGANTKTLKNGLPSAAFGQGWLNLSTAASGRTALGVSRQFAFGIDGGTSVPATGNLNAVYVSPITCTIVTWYIGSNVTGNAVMDIKRNGVSIIGGGNKPTLTATSKSSANVSGWTSTAITAGDRLTFTLDSVTTSNAITTVIKVTE